MSETRKAKLVTSVSYVTAYVKSPPLNEFYVPKRQPLDD